MVTFILVVFAVLVVVGALGTVASVDKPRKPVTHGVAAAVTFIAMLELAALAYLNSQL